MKFDRIQGILFLIFDADSDQLITFKDKWAEMLRSLPYDQYGVYIRAEIYPALTDTEQKIWKSTTISNLALRDAVEAFFSIGVGSGLSL
jgi:hypothetical protein